MKILLFISIIILMVSSCSSVDSINKSPHCIVWKNQEIWGPYSVDVIGKKIEWKGACKGYNRGCTEILITLDENNNVLHRADVLGKIENNELRFAEKHVLFETINFTGVRAYPEQKLVKSSMIINAITTEDSFQYNDKCSAEEAITGAVALGLISKSQTRELK